MNQANGEDAVFRREGEYWTISYGSEIVRIRHTNGLDYIASLLDRPGERLPVRTIVDDDGGLDAKRRRSPQGPVALERERIRVTKAIRNAIRRIKEHAPRAGTVFEETIRTGRYCSYHPRPWDPVGWKR